MSNSTENVTARQRPNARPEVDDLELGNGGGVNSEKEKSSANSVSDQPGMLSANPKSAGMESARRARDAITEQLEDGAEEIRKFWGVFMRKDKPKIGVVQSLRAFFFSTCTYIPVNFEASNIQFHAYLSCFGATPPICFRYRSEY
jgi:hypothetical protein